MKIAMIHYHLNRGGVTQVIANQLKALNGQVQPGSRLPVVLLYGGRKDGWPQELTNQLERLDLSLLTVDELDYDNVRPRRDELPTRLLSAISQAGFQPNETVVHVHNHALGKNAALPGAIATLARAGYSLLLHIHDFAEDFRPENYRHLAANIGANGWDELPDLLYPQAPQIHYAVLNGRDRSILLDAGIDASRLHLLPNAVAEIDSLPPRAEARKSVFERFGIARRDRFVLYPVRGIRRKNLGEALLWSALAKGDNCFGITLPPLNPREQPSYERWKRFAAENDLCWVFEMGGANGADYADNLAAADLILTTSVAEGFGLVFLEAWLAGRGLVGRDLPEITTDFVANGVQFTGINPKLWVPVSWLDEKSFRTEVSDSFRSVLASYGQPIVPAQKLLDLELEKMIRNGMLDFAHCSVVMQRHVIEKVAHETASREVLLEANPWIEDALEMETADSELIDQNAEIVRSKYSLIEYGRRLREIYKVVDLSDRDDGLKSLVKGSRILESFLSLTRFHQLRVES